MNLKHSAKILLACGLLSFSAFNPVMAASLDQEMYVMQTNVGGMLNATDASSFLKHLDAMKQAATVSLDLVPTSLLGKASDSAEIQDYKHGMQSFIDVLEQAETLAKNGDLEQAKEKAREVLSIRNEYHKKYR
ncbi:cytochrome B562 [Mergibacter septicus]|uniref:cytochrome b562 n=1 Tax=Mergibacter septicus TaxID=221402 RepID=UPI001C76A297|nr:cytochrome b562 [Mergibacter septicus]QDJ12755.1 cytochrome B562 [Mergibacter septicus]